MILGHHRKLGNGVCDKACNHYDCLYDFGDCNRNVEYHATKKWDEFEVSVFTTMVKLNQLFGVKERPVQLHHAYMMNRRVLYMMEREFKDDVKRVIHHRFRYPDDLYYEYFYFNYLNEIQLKGNRNKVSIMWKLLDLNGNGELDLEELYSLRNLYLPEYNTTVDVERMLRRCCKDKCDSINQSTFFNCQDAIDAVYSHFVYLQRVPRMKGNTISNYFMNLFDDIPRTQKMMNVALRTRPKLLCVNDNMIHKSEKSVKQVNQFYSTLFPQKSQFEKRFWFVSFQTHH